ncbi:MAG: alpha/beta hydrolase [Deltaproteobacteria bacterium]|nr:alpha/beta hydrolase [Deltaproteobacteria bacterium]
MKHQEGFFKGVRDASIYFQGWLPESEPKAVLLIVHGLAEHGGRYTNVVNHFVPRDYAVYGIDHLGHGKSEGTRVYVKRFDDYTNTLKVYFDMIHRWQPDKPIFLVGHSMGGLISAVFLLDHHAELAGAVLSGPAVKVPSNITPAILLVGKMFSALMPKFGLLGLDADGVSRDPAVVQAYVSDPLVYTGKTTARLAAEMLRAMQQVSRQASQITLPIMIVQGSGDKLIDPAGAQMLYDSVSSTDKEIIIYDGFYHEVFNEPEHDKVLRDIERWLEAHLGSRK